MTPQQAYPLSWPAGWPRSRFSVTSGFGSHSISECVDDILRQLRLIGAQSKVTGKRNKTDEDHFEIGRIEFFAGLYTESGKIILPADCIDATLLNAAKRYKLGQSYKSGCYVKNNGVLRFDGDALPVEKLWERGRNALRVAVKVKNAKTMRTRPMFEEWSTEFEVEYFDDSFDDDQIELIVKVAGELIGIGDWRPRYGRFKSEVVK